MANLHDLAFWQALERFGDAPAIFDEASKTRLSYEELESRIRHGADMLSGPHKGLVWLAAHNDLGALCCYLSALRAGHAVCLWPGHSPFFFDDRILEKYKPDIFLWRERGQARQAPVNLQRGPDMFGYRYGCIPTRPIENRALALLMPTSGSTGSPKLARLSWENIECSANQVVDALQITADQRTATMLPMSFIYGLTVINSHLKAGASIVLTERSVYDRAFWSMARSEAISTLPAVPWTIQALREIHFQQKEYPRLQRVTISGGHLTQSLLGWLTETLHDRGVRIYSMYGQTEACGRMTVLPPSMFVEKPHSVGAAVPGGKIECDSGGQIVYTGPNVMLGYAMDRSELEKEDELHGVLHTGDLGYIDDQASLYISGRINRVSKIFGLRIDLDDLERRLGTTSTAVIEEADQLHVFVADSDLPADQLRTRLAALLPLPHHLLNLNIVDALPRTSSGKIAYGELKRRAQQSGN